MDTSRIIIAPIVSEKSMSDVAKNRYTFKVEVKANKDEIRKEISRKFKVDILKISTIIIKGRKYKSGARRSEVLQSPFKKAIVTVKVGQKISIFDQGA
jgi:large subunit ribosomal protein L23